MESINLINTTNQFFYTMRPGIGEGACPNGMLEPWGQCNAPTPVIISGKDLKVVMIGIMITGFLVLGFLTFLVHRKVQRVLDLFDEMEKADNINAQEIREINRRLDPIIDLFSKIDADLMKVVESGY